MPHYTTSYSTKKKPHPRKGEPMRLPTARPHMRRQPGVQYLRHSQGFGRRSINTRRPSPRRESRKPYALIAIGCSLVVFFASVVWYLNRGVDVTLNGSTVSVRINSSVEQLIADEDLNYRAGNLLAVDDSVLELRGGEAYSVQVDGEQIDNADLGQTRLTGGEELVIGDGRDEYEEHDVQATTIEPGLSVKGSGAVKYVETWGITGRSEVWVGKVSGKTQDRGVVKEAQDCVVRCSSVNPDSGKYVALTFDQGPSSYTQQIVDILKQKGVGATFFLQEDAVQSNQGAVAAIADAGFEIGLDSATGQDLTAVTAEGLRASITQGFDAIEAAGGGRAAMFRPVTGEFSDQNWADSMDLYSAVVTWNLNSGDWVLPGADQVIDVVTSSVGNGTIVLLTANETVGAQTVEALPDMIDQLVADGYSIVSISDLVKTDAELAAAVDLSSAQMPEDASLPQPATDGAVAQS